MKSYLTPLLFSVASLVAISANAGAPSYFIPTEPTVMAPADQASNVAITPELVSSDFQITEESNWPSETILSKSNWVITKKDDNITLLAGEKSHYIFNNAGIQNNFIYDIPFPVTISGQTVTTLETFFNPDTTEFGQAVHLKNSTGDLLADTVIGFDDYSFQADKMFIIAKISDNSILLQSHLINTENSELIAEFILADNGFNEDNSERNDIFGWRTSPNELTNTLFDSPNNYANCRVNQTNPKGSIYSVIEQYMTNWKTFHSGNGESKFTLACFSALSEMNPNEFSLTYGAFTSTQISPLSDSLITYSSNQNSYTLTDNEALDLATEYNVQVQHIGASGNENAASLWSTPLSFSTRAADTNYQVTAPTDLAFTTGMAKELIFKITNTGTDSGSPKVIVRLPFEVSSTLNGTLTDFFNVTVDGESCSLLVSAGKTDFECQIESLSVAAEAQLIAKVTVNDIIVQSIEYQVCDLDKCDDTAFTAINISVTASSDPAPADSDVSIVSETSSSSSSGGSMFWLFLMTPLLLLRRK